jgi:prophage antirepressor-like protein
VKGEFTMSDSNSIISYPASQSKLSIFNYHSFEIHACKDAKGDPLFMAVDVCNALDIENAKQAVSRLDPEESTIIYLSSRDTINAAYTTYPSEEFNKSFLMVKESGLYRLIFTSRKPEAETFRKWVFNEVLPSIRKTGSYSVEKKELSALDILEQHVVAMRAHERELAEHGDRLDRLESVVSTRGTDYMTIKAYCSYRKYKGLSKQTAIDLGKRAAAASRSNGYEIGKVPDETHGKVGSYHMDILAMVVDGYFTGKYD